MRHLRHVVVVGLLVLGTSSVALATPPRRTIATAGTRLLVPAGWLATVSEPQSCDPERLIAVSSAPLRVSSGGAIGAPARGQVVVLLLEDRLRVDRPSGDLRRPTHFSVTWNRSTRLKPARFCGNPDAPAFMRHLETRGRYLGLIVYPGAQTEQQVRAETLAVMDSLRGSG
jgi:hypothetical protein